MKQKRRNYKKTINIESKKERKQKQHRNNKNNDKNNEDKMYDFVELFSLSLAAKKTTKYTERKATIQENMLLIQYTLDMYGTQESKMSTHTSH